MHKTCPERGVCYSTQKVGFKKTNLMGKFALAQNSDPVYKLLPGGNK